MDELGWWSASQADDLCNWLFFEQRASQRKLRLFAIACCHRIAHLATFRADELLQLAEQVADGVRQQRSLEAVCAPLWEPRDPTPEELQDRPYTDTMRSADLAVLSAADVPTGPDGLYRDPDYYRIEDMSPAFQMAAWHAAEAVASARSAAHQAECQQQVYLLLDIFWSLPFQEVVIDPGWLTSDVVALAKGIYDRKAFDRMPILADALQGAGCTNDEVLSHCRAEGWEHVRGCWVVDLLLGRPWRENG